MRYTLPMPLKTEEESALFKRLSDGDKVAESILVEHNLRFVNVIVRDLAFSTDEFDDLYQIGSFALLKAIRNFKPDYGFKFTSYAALAIKNEILSFRRKLVKYPKVVSMYKKIDTLDSTEINLLEKIPDIVDEYSVFENLNDINKALEYLKPKEKLIINMRYGLSNNKPLKETEIANKLGHSQGYISRILHRVHCKLKNIYENGRCSVT